MEAQLKTIILDHCRRYPALLPQDLIKFLFQSAFGCEHLVQDVSLAAQYIRQEAANCCAQVGPLVEQLAGPYCRVHLDYLKQGLCAETLAKLFALSARHEEQGPARLEQLLKIVQSLLQEKALPFSAEHWTQAVENWSAEGFPPCRHSPIFHAVYQPAYRLLLQKYVAFLPLFARIDPLMCQKEQVLVAIDGGSASGKTTLGELLHQVYDCQVFHMDDFFLRPEQRTPERLAEPGGNVDRERFEQEVLLPLRQGREISLRRYDCGTASLCPPVTIHSGKLSIVEGSYSLHPDLAKYYDLTAFLQIDPLLQHQRIQKRNSPEMAQRFFDLWVPLEQAYSQAMKPQERCDLLLPAGDGLVF